MQILRRSGMKTLIKTSLARYQLVEPWTAS